MDTEEVLLSEVTVSFGSNYGDRRNNVENAQRWFSSIAEDCRHSSIYETPEIHGKGKPYMNAVASGAVRLDMGKLHELSKIFEAENGRDEERRKRGEVPIDVDIVLWNAETVRPADFAREFFQIGFREINKNFC